jgi:hypothetical protein
LREATLQPAFQYFLQPLSATFAAKADFAWSVPFDTGET